MLVFLRDSGGNVLVKISVFVTDNMLNDIRVDFDHQGFVRMLQTLPDKAMELISFRNTMLSLREWVWARYFPYGENKPSGFKALCDAIYTILNEEACIFDFYIGQY